MLAAQAGKNADRLEAEFFVQCDRAAVAVLADHRNHLAEAARFASLHQFCKQGVTYASALERGRDVDRVFHGPAVTHAAAIRTGIRVACEVAIAFGNQVRKSVRDEVAQALGHFCFAWHVVFIGRHALAHFHRVERLYGSDVGQGRGAEQQVQSMYRFSKSP